MAGLAVVPKFMDGRAAQSEPRSRFQVRGSLPLENDSKYCTCQKGGHDSGQDHPGVSETRARKDAAIEGKAGTYMSEDTCG